MSVQIPTHRVAKDDLEILRPRTSPPGCQDYKYALLHLVYVMLRIKPSASCTLNKNTLPNELHTQTHFPYFKFTQLLPNYRCICKTFCSTLHSQLIMPIKHWFIQLLCGICAPVCCKFSRYSLLQSLLPISPQDHRQATTPRLTGALAIFLFVCLGLLFCFSLCCPSYPRTCSVHQTGLEHRDRLVFASQVLGLKAQQVLYPLSHLPDLSIDSQNYSTINLLTILLVEIQIICNNFLFRKRSSESIVTQALISIDNNSQGQVQSFSRCCQIPH